MSAEHQDSGVPVVPWPTEITAENCAAISDYLGENKNLQAATALVMVEEANTLMQEEWKIFSSLDLEIASRPDVLWGYWKDWDSYLRPPYAVLNVESILETGRPFQSPGQDFEAIDREGRMSFGDFLLDEDEQKELKVQRKTAGEISWFIRELTLVELYKVTKSPLEFVDTVVNQEAERLQQQDRKDMGTVRNLSEAVEQFKRERDEDAKSQDATRHEEVMEFIEGVSSKKTKKKMEAMEAGRQRFHQLYQVFNH